MKELTQKINGIINAYFDEKVRDVNWYYDVGAKERVSEMIAECLKSVADTIKDCNNSIDEYLENFEEEHWRDKQEEYKLVLDDMRTQDRMEESLWN